MYNQVQLFYEPQKILEQKTNGDVKKYSEMTDFQQAFLCGLLREKRPKKIVELGVAAGGTTAVILNCLNMIDDSCEMYSLDISEQWYRSADRRTGFLVNDYPDVVGNVKHQFMFNSIPHVIDKIGGVLEI